MSGVVAITVSLLVGDYLSHRGANLPTFARGVAALFGLVIVFFVVALADLAAFLTARSSSPSASSASRSRYGIGPE